MTEDEMDVFVELAMEKLQVMQQALTDIADSLRIIKEATLVELRTEIANNQIVEQMQGQRAKNAGEVFVAGGHPLRDGDSYGIVAAQPQTTTSPEPPVHAYHPPGHLRSSDEC